MHLAEVVQIVHQLQVRPKSLERSSVLGRVRVTAFACVLSDWKSPTRVLEVQLSYSAASIYEFMHPDISIYAAPQLVAFFMYF